MHGKTQNVIGNLGVFPALFILPQTMCGNKCTLASDWLLWWQTSLSACSWSEHFFLCCCLCLCELFCQRRAPDLTRYKLIKHPCIPPPPPLPHPFTSPYLLSGANAIFSKISLQRDIAILEDAGGFLLSFFFLLLFVSDLLLPPATPSFLPLSLFLNPDLLLNLSRTPLIWSATRHDVVYPNGTADVLDALVSPSLPSLSLCLSLYPSHSLSLSGSNSFKVFCLSGVISLGRPPPCALDGVTTQEASSKYPRFCVSGAVLWKSRCNNDGSVYENIQKNPNVAVQTNDFVWFQGFLGKN